MAASIGLIVVFAVEVDRGPVGIVLAAALVLALAATVAEHRRRRPRRSSRGPDPSLRTPGQLALATAIVVTAGSAVAVLASLLLAAVASSSVGDGRVAVRLLFALFAICPCVALGSRCGRWWAFTGALGLVPLLAFAMLVEGRATTGIGLLVVAVLASALGLAAGSLSRDLAAGDGRERRQPSAAAAPVAGPPVPAHRASRAGIRGG